MFTTLVSYAVCTADGSINWRFRRQGMATPGYGWGEGFHGNIREGIARGILESRARREGSSRVNMAPRLELSVRWARSQRGRQTGCGQRRPREENKRETKDWVQGACMAKMAGLCGGFGWQGKVTVWSLGWGLKALKRHRYLCYWESLEASPCFSVLIGTKDPCMPLTTVRMVLW